MAKGEPFRPVRLTTHVVMWFDRCSVADRALVARYTKRKQEAEADSKEESDRGLAVEKDVCDEEDEEEEDW